MNCSSCCWCWCCWWWWSCCCCCMGFVVISATLPGGGDEAAILDCGGTTACDGGGAAMLDGAIFDWWGGADSVATIFFFFFFLWLELMHFWNIHHYTDGTYVHNIQISHAPKAVPTWAHKRISSGCKLVMWVWRTKYEMTQNTIKETKVIFFSLKLDMKYVINICKYVNVRVFIGSLTFLLALTSVYLLFCWLVGIS